MSENQISNAARRSLALTVKDGLWDLLLGSFFVFLALQDPLEQRGIAVWVSYLPAFAVMGIGLVLYMWAKRRIITPRIGLVKISLRRSKERRTVLGLAIGLQLFTLLVYILAMTGWLGRTFPSQPGWLMDALFGVLIFAFFAVFAYTMDTSRFYLYGILLGLTPPLGVILRPEGAVVTTVPQFITGLVMVVCGAWVFARFLRQYPLNGQENAHV